MMEDTAPVRPGEELDTAALARYLGAPVAVEQFPGGHSNLTYLVRTQGTEYVLRRAPFGPVPAKAHDMAREYRVLAAVGPYFAPAPRVHRLCEDTAVLGSAFFLMERRRGVILRQTVPESHNHPERVSQAWLDCLVQFHAVDVTLPEIAALGKPEGFVQRQVHGWSERWRRAQTTRLPEIERVMEWLAANIPKSGAPTLVHNDYKLDNLMLDPADAGRVEALLDWEMTTVGDPLADFGLALTYWAHADVPGMRRVTAESGWWTRDRLVEEYARRTGRELTALPYHEVLGVFKLAVILQQIFYRYHHGQTADARFRHFDEAVALLARTGVRLMERGA